jgi:hypothetical protein
LGSERKPNFHNFEYNAIAAYISGWKWADWWQKYLEKIMVFIFIYYYIIYFRNNNLLFRFSICLNYPKPKSQITVFNPVQAETPRHFDKFLHKNAGRPKNLYLYMTQ